MPYRRLEDQKAWRKAHHESILKEAKIYRRVHRKRIRTYQKAWRKENPGKIKQHRKRAKKKGREYRLRQKYGLSLADFEKQRRRQNKKCAICGRKGFLVVDHHHSTQIVRGLLCALCNIGLGAFKDCPKRLVKASLYLSKFKVSEKLQQQIERE